MSNALRNWGKNVLITSFFPKFQWIMKNRHFHVRGPEFHNVIFNVKNYAFSTMTSLAYSLSAFECLLSYTWKKKEYNKAVSLGLRFTFFRIYNKTISQNVPSLIFLSKKLIITYVVCQLSGTNILDGSDSNRLVLLMM